MALQPGTHLGVFEILAPLGKGGMGEVYRAKDTKLERENWWILGSLLMAFTTVLTRGRTGAETEP